MMERNETHWHVANGTPGYLFDSEDLITFETRAEAVSYAKAEARDERDQRNENASWSQVKENETLVFQRIPLARTERWSVSDRVGRKGPFAVAIDRNLDSHSLPYQWEGWECDETHEDET